MTVEQLSQNADFKILSMPHPEREINGGYVGDLLSWVMGRAESDNAWITIMSNINVIAVASLSDVSCVILTEGVTLEADVLETAKQKEINVLSTRLTSFETVAALSGKI